MSNRSDAVKRWRENTKRRAVESLGGKCCICGYNKCIKSMDFHHLDPKDKEIGIGDILSHPISWDKIAEELRKCILVCSNCHGEIHCGITRIPDNPSRFNELYLKKGGEITSPCPICGKEKPAYMITCSKKCALTKARGVDWDKIDILSLKKQGKSHDAIGDMLGVSGTAVWKRIKKISRKTDLICPYCKSSFNYKNKNKKYCSEKCSRMASRKAVRPNIEQLKKDILEMPMVQVGKKYGVSDNAVRKWLNTTI